MRTSEYHLFAKKAQRRLQIILNQELDDLNVYKPNGPDGIPARMLKETSNEITEAMTVFFKASLTQSDIPDIWREALIPPLFKRGKKDCNKAENYRPRSF